MAIQVKEYKLKGRLAIPNVYIRLAGINNVQEMPEGWRASGRFDLYENKEQSALPPKDEKADSPFPDLLARRRPEALYSFDVSADWEKGTAPEKALYAAAMKQDICKDGIEV